MSFTMQNQHIHRFSKCHILKTFDPKPFADIKITSFKILVEKKSCNILNNGDGPKQHITAYVPNGVIMYQLGY
jgi:hypothetical protein